MWINEYLVYPPLVTPFLPSDEVVNTLVDKTPHMQLMDIMRTATHASFRVRVPDKGIFSKRACPEVQAKLQVFLQRVAEIALASPPLSASTEHACDVFLGDMPCVWMEWNGTWVTAYNAQGMRFEGRLPQRQPYSRYFNAIHRACRQLPPFTYGVAPW